MSAPQSAAASHSRPGDSVQPSSVRHRGFVRLFASLVAVVFLVLTPATAILYRRFERLYVEAQHQRAVALLSQTRTVFASIHSWLFPAFIQFSEQHSIRQLMYGEGHSLEETVVGVRALGDSGGFYPLLHSIYLYNGRTGEVYSSVRGREDPVRLSDPGLFATITRIRENDRPTYYPRRVRAVDAAGNEAADTTPENVFTVLIGERVHDDGTLAGGMVVNVSEESFRLQFLPAATAAGGELVIVDRNGTILSHPNPDLFGEVAAEHQYVARTLSEDRDEGAFIAEVEGVESLVTFVVHEIMGWRFIAITPYRRLIAPVHRSRDVTLLVFVLVAGGGAAAAFGISKRFYTPIDHLFRRALIASNANPVLQTTSEFDFVEQVLTGAVLRADALGRDLKSRQGRESKRVVCAILCGDTRPAEDGSTDELSDVHRSLLGGRYVVLVLRFDDYGSRTENPRGYAVRGTVAMAVEAWAAHAGFGCITIDMEGDHLVVVRDGVVAGRDEPSALPDEIEAQAGDLVARLRNEHTYSVTIGVSRSNVAVDRLPAAYREALDAAQFRFRYGGGSVIRADRLPPLPQTPYRFPEDAVHQLFAKVRQGQVADLPAGIVGAVDTVLPYTASDFRHLKEMVSYLAERDLFPELNEASLPLTPQEGLTTTDIRRCETVTELRSLLETQLASLADRFASECSRRQMETIDRACRYIEEHVGDPSLNADGVAEVVGLSTNYLRTIFKRVHGESLSRYINDRRLETCRRLLIETDRTVREIQEAAGFVSYNYFFENFKRTFGMTPGRYRATHLRTES